jgi:regulator of protease activity HflC (stomatin/prohibitin superfamily)
MTSKRAWHMNGFLFFLIILALNVGSISIFVSGLPQENGLPVFDDASLQSVAATDGNLAMMIVGIVLSVLTLSFWSGFVLVQPNEAFVLLFFGRYVGSVETAGFWFCIPYTTRQRVTLRVTNFNTKQLKVNDANGNPIEIAAVVVFKVADSAKARLDVENYLQFVETQSETALRHVANSYPYDDFEGTGMSLRGNADEIANQLANELKTRLFNIAGVAVLEARLTHLAYSSEVASMMLQRQQASAIVAARQTIVEGAVGMVKLALAKLEADGIVHLDEERKATMVNNLMVAIVSERAAQPVINSGSIY